MSLKFWEMLEGEERERREESTTQEVDIEVAKRVETSLRPFNCGSFNFRGLNFVVEILEKHVERNDRNNRKKHRI